MCSKSQTRDSPNICIVYRRTLEPRNIGGCGPYICIVSRRTPEPRNIGGCGHSWQVSMVEGKTQNLSVYFLAPRN